MSQEQNRMVLDISTKSIIKLISIIVGIYFLFYIRDVIILFFFVLIIVAALNPIVDRWSEEMPRTVAISLLFLLIALFLIAAGLLIVPPLVQQIEQFAQNIPDYISKWAPAIESLRNISSESQRTLFSVSNQLANFGENLLTTTLGVVSGIVALLTVVASSFYLLSEKDKANRFFRNLPIENKDTIAEVIDKIGQKMGSWLRSQLTLMTIIGAISTVAMLILGVPYALALGIWAGLMEAIPYIGPVLGAVPAVLVALTVSPIKALILLVIFVLVQQLEGQILVPKIMGKAVGLSPVVIIFAVLIGARLYGLMGVLLAVPAAAVLSVLYQEYPKLKNLNR
jgi:predicted PurR-regulated permease PerM